MRGNTASKATMTKGKTFSFPELLLLQQGCDAARQEDQGRNEDEKPAYRGPSHAEIGGSHGFKDSENHSSDNRPYRGTKSSEDGDHKGDEGKLSSQGRKQIIDGEEETSRRTDKGTADTKRDHPHLPDIYAHEKGCIDVLGRCPDRFAGIRPGKKNQRATVMSTAIKKERDHGKRE